MDSFLDKFFRWLRFRKVIKYVPRNSIVCDLGCGSNAYFLKNISNFIEYGVGLDKDIEDSRGSKLKFKKVKILRNIPLEEKSFDVVTIIAVLEHLTNAQKILNESFRILRDGGKLILTTPGPLAKPILEILAYKLRLIDKTAIQDHRNYFWPGEIKKMLLEAGFERKSIKSHFFECCLNSLTVAQK